MLPFWRTLIPRSLALAFTSRPRFGKQGSLFSCEHDEPFGAIGCCLGYNLPVDPCRLTASVWIPLALCACTSDGDGRVHAGDGSDGGASVPKVQIGYDAIRRWDQMANVRVGTRTYMRSTYDRSGGNEGADASHFLREEAVDRSVTLDVAGPGVLSFVRTNHWHGSPWHYTVDDVDHVVTESSTADPTNPVAGSVFQPQTAFPSPLTETWSVTRGADLSWVQIPFERTLTLAYGRTHYGTGYYVYELFPDGDDDVSTPIKSFDESPPPSDVLALVGSAGADIAPTGIGVETKSGSVDVPALTTVPLLTLSGARIIRALTLRIPTNEAIAASHVRVRITWDDRREPSVDAPLTLFFGTGSFYNRASAEWLVKALLTTVHFSATALELSTYFPMPFRSVARIELVGAQSALSGLEWSVRSVANDTPPGTAGYFHATYVDHTPLPGQDLVVLDTAKVEGGGDQCGSFVGMSWIFSDQAVLSTLEGDPRFFFDDSMSPQAQGTGTEEWGGGGDYWGGQTMTLPFAGHPVGAPSPAAMLDPEDGIESAYRILVADAMPFGKNARIQIEHGGGDESTEHYQSVAYWYGLPRACLVLTDTLHVGDPTDEGAHRYSSPSASAPMTVSSRYEWGVDHLGATEIFPETTDVGRVTTGPSELSLKLSPRNVGVLLRRKLDYSFRDQRAEVFIADDVAGAPFERAGTWYLAGSNSCIYSNPPGELDPPSPVVEQSNRRWREDEFLVPRKLTQGRSAIRVRIVPTGVPNPLLPGETTPAGGWSEFRYSAYSWVLPGP